MGKDMKKIDCELLYHGEVIKKFDMKIAKKDRFEYKKNDENELRIPRDLVYKFMKEFISKVIYKLKEPVYKRDDYEEDIDLLLSESKIKNTYNYEQLKKELIETCVT